MLWCFFLGGRGGLSVAVGEGEGEGEGEEEGEGGGLLLVNPGGRVLYILQAMRIISRAFQGCLLKKKGVHVRSE